MRDIRKRRIIILILAAAAILLATGAYISVPSGVKDIEIVTSDGERVEESLDVYIGENVQLRCRISPQAFAHRDVEYYVSDEEIISVDKSGMLSGIKEGQTTLIVACAGVRKRVSIDVEPSVREIKGLEKEITLYVDDEYQFEPEVVMTDEDLEVPAVKYNSRRKTVATVDNNGLLTAMGEGTTKISIKAGTLSESVKVKVEERPVDVDPVYFAPSNTKTVSVSKKTASNKNGRDSKNSKKRNKSKTKSENTAKQGNESGGKSVPDNGSGKDDNTDSDSGTGDSGNSNTGSNGTGDSGSNSSDSGDKQESGSAGDSGNSNTGSNDTGDSGNSNTGSTGTGDSGNSNTGSKGAGDSGNSNTGSNVSGNSGNSPGSDNSDSGSSGSASSNSGGTGSGNSSSESNSEADPNNQTDANLIGD